MPCLNNVCLKWDAGSVIRTALLGDEDLHKLVGNNIFPIVAPEPKNGQKDLGNFIVYRRSNYSRQDGKFGITEDSAKIEITVVSDDYDMSVAIAELVDTVLNATSTECNGSFYLDNSYETFEDLKYCQTLEFIYK